MPLRDLAFRVPRTRINPVRILIVAATRAEIAFLASHLDAGTARGPRLTTYVRAGHTLDLLTTGVGMVATASWCSSALASASYDVALNVGVCGSFDQALPPPTVVHIISDRLSEMGAEDGDGFLSFETLSALRDPDLEFDASRPINTAPPRNRALDALPRVDAITVNTVHGDDSSIALIRSR
jgi:futalosine hydrolase